LNRKFDPNRGAVCSLTGQIADFDLECENFKIDNSAVIVLDNRTPLFTKENQAKLPAEIFNQLRKQQNLTKAIIAGVVVALLCAILWATFTVNMKIQSIGMVILLGVSVGFAMRWTGKGIDNIFGVSGAIISVLGCILGNFLSVIGFMTQENDLSYLETLLRFDYSYFGDVMVETFYFKQIVYYMFAAGIGFVLSKKIITDKTAKELSRKQN